MFEDLKSNNLKFELVQEADAEFILALRQNPKLNQFISPTDISVAMQRQWIQKYKLREAKGQEYYFRIDALDGEQLGFVRIYDIDIDSGVFAWGSWILKEDKPAYAGMESIALVYEFAFSRLSMQSCLFEVMKENRGLVKFHKMYGARNCREDEGFAYFEISQDDYEKRLKTRLRNLQRLYE